MQLRNTFVAFAFSAALAGLPAIAQEANELPRSEATVQAIGSFVKDTTDNNVRQSATHSGGVLAGYRYFFNANHGVEVNYGYTLNTQSYGLGNGPVGINAYSHEATAAYVFRYPLRRITPFVEAGVGGLVFDPRNFTGANMQARAAFVYGAGADFNFSSRVYFRAGYRGLVYNSPTFELSGLDGLDRLSHRAEPAAGIGIRF